MIQMMQGHALTILSGMPRDALFDAVITDPPYASGAATQNGISAKTSTKYTSSKTAPIQTLKGTQWTAELGKPDATGAAGGAYAKPNRAA